MGCYTECCTHQTPRIARGIRLDALAFDHGTRVGQYQREGLGHEPAAGAVAHVGAGGRGRLDATTGGVRTVVLRVGDHVDFTGVQYLLVGLAEGIGDDVNEHFTI